MAIDTNCVASHYSGTLDELEAHVCAVELARSLAAAAAHRRTDIELPGALRYLSGLCQAIYSALHIIRGLDPDTFLIADTLDICHNCPHRGDLIRHRSIRQTH